MSIIVVDELQASDGGTPLKLPKKDGTSGQSLQTDGKGQLKFADAAAAASGSSGSSSTSPVGQAFYGFGEGIANWTCPPDVTSVCVVCIGGGSGNQGGATSSGHGGGGGGGLGWKNDITVVPGTVYELQMGHGGDLGMGGGGYASQHGAGKGGHSYFIDTSTVSGHGGDGYTGGSYTGEGGGAGGNGNSSGSGGGAGGYTGNGAGYNGGAGSGGSASGGRNYSSTWGWPSGGGVGPWGQANSGDNPPNPGSGGLGGSGGEDGRAGENGYTSKGQLYRPGGLYGGGAGGVGDNSYWPQSLDKGGRGCVRIIWGNGRAFPATGTGDM